MKKINISLAEILIKNKKDRIEILEKIKEKLLNFELKLDYRDSMKKYYSAEALKDLIREIKVILAGIEGDYSQLAIWIKNGWDTEFIEKDIEMNKVKLVELIEKKNILEKHFKVE